MGGIGRRTRVGRRRYAAGGVRVRAGAEIAAVHADAAQVAVIGQTAVYAEITVVVLKAGGLGWLVGGGRIDRRTGRRVQSPVRRV